MHVISINIMLSIWELWACAQQTIKAHGNHAPVFVAERIGQLALEGDEDGVATWKAIAARIEQMGDFAKTRSKLRHCPGAPLDRLARDVPPSFA